MGSVSEVWKVLVKYREHRATSQAAFSSQNEENNSRSPNHCRLTGILPQRKVPVNESPLVVIDSGEKRDNGLNPHWCCLLNLLI